MPALLPASQCTNTVSPMFTLVIHAHVTCTCVHAHDPAFGDHARLEPRLNAADNMHARARAFWCASRRTIQTGRTVCVYACFHQFLYSFCTVSVIPFALTSRERCQRAAWSACHTSSHPRAGKPSGLAGWAGVLICAAIPCHQPRAPPPPPCAPPLGRRAQPAHMRPPQQ